MTELRGCVRELIALLACVMVLPSCRDSAQVVDRPSARAATSTLNSIPEAADEMQRRAAEIDALIASEYGDDGPQVQRVITAARQHWAERLRACADASCRRAVLDDRMNRFNFSLGRHTAPVPGVGWETGLVHIDAGSTGGSLTVFPIVEGRLLVSVLTVNRGTGSTCEMTAAGRFMPDGSVEMTSLDEAQLRFRFHRQSERRWAIDPVGPSENVHCGTMGGIDASYQTEFVRQ